MADIETDEDRKPDTAEVDARIAQIQRAIDAGHYSVDADRIAATLTERGFPGKVNPE